MASRLWCLARQAKLWWNIDRFDVWRLLEAEFEDRITESSHGFHSDLRACGTARSCSNLVAQ